MLELSHWLFAVLAGQSAVPDIGGHVVLGFLIHTLLSQGKPDSAYSTTESN